MRGGEGGEGGEKKQSAGKTYLGMRREIQVSSFAGTAARRRDKKNTCRHQTLASRPGTESAVYETCDTHQFNVGVQQLRYNDL